MTVTTPLDRIRTTRDLTAMVAMDTAAGLAARFEQLLSHGRRMCLSVRVGDGPAEVTAGLTLAEPTRLSTTAREVIYFARLAPNLSGFGISAYANEGDTEADIWRRFRAHGGIYRRDMTQVTVRGGLPGAGPDRTDQIAIRRWNTAGAIIEHVVGFDFDTARTNSLTVIGVELRAHLAGLPREPWEHEDILTRLLAALDANAAVAGGEG